MEYRMITIPYGNLQLSLEVRNNEGMITPTTRTLLWLRNNFAPKHVRNIISSVHKITTNN